MTRTDLARRALGICIACRRADARPGYLRCVECAERQAAASRAFRIRCLEQGRCVSCGDEARPGVGRCDRCEARQTQTAKRWRAAHPEWWATPKRIEYLERHPERDDYNPRHSKRRKGLAAGAWPTRDETDDVFSWLRGGWLSPYRPTMKIPIQHTVTIHTPPSIEVIRAATPERHRCSHPQCRQWIEWCETWPMGAWLALSCPVDVLAIRYGGPGAEISIVANDAAHFRTCPGNADWRKAHR